MVNSFLPILAKEAPDGDFTGRWWTEQSDGRILCHLCPRACRLKPGDRGFCFVRMNKNGKMVLDSYGRSTGFCIDPIEKKPLNHFLPGTPVLSFGTAGCNLGCKFCQNWDISKSREVSRISNLATPLDIAVTGLNQGCRSVAFTYNDPIVWAEYALDTAKACHDLGLSAVAVTAGYLTETARPDFFSLMDAANIDLKGFTEDFYQKFTGGHLQPVLDTIRYAVRETDCWVELTNLVIPGANDDPDNFKRMIDWILTEIGCDVPIHFTAFHPDFQMRDISATPHETLSHAYAIALQAGLNYVYLGNLHDLARQSTYCPKCQNPLIQRDWHQITQYKLDINRCRDCDTRIPGRFEMEAGSWGRQRQPVTVRPHTETFDGPDRP
ncbi:MAG: AmmeMemoRadiSam system radical SAM enzyme [Rubripirellula sp.]|jgi:AmmeMemoRadiSam system radical SAM enzyme